MLSALSTNRNFTSCCDDIRPFITTVANTTPATTTTTSTTTTTTTTDLANITELNVELLTANIANITTGTVTNLTSNNITTQTISDFTVNAGDDVEFLGEGVTSSDRLLWDSSGNTLYVDGSIKTRNCVMWLNNSSLESPLTISDANKDTGIVFKWFDDGVTQQKLGFFGFKDSTDRFIFNSNVSLNESNCTITGVSETVNDIETRDLYTRNIINEDNSRNLGITSISNINILGNNLNLNSTSDINLNSTSGDILFTTNNGDMNLDITGDMSIDINNGMFDILLNGDFNDTITIENTLGDIDILSGSTSSQSIYLKSNNGGILIENDSISNDLILKTTNNIQLSTTGSTIVEFNESDGLTSNIPKTDYLKWIPYYNFDALSGFWLSIRSTPSNPLHFWRKELNAETALIQTDIDISSRTTSNKGSRLKTIYFAYKITNNSITSISSTLTLKSFNPSIPSAGPTLTNIPISDGTNGLSTGTSINDHYRSIIIDTPSYLNSQGVLNIELEIVTPNSSVFDFYGLHLEYDNNVL